MPKDLLASQFDALESPDDVLRVDIDSPLESIVEAIRDDLSS